MVGALAVYFLIEAMAVKKKDEAAAVIRARVQDLVNTQWRLCTIRIISWSEAPGIRPTGN